MPLANIWPARVGERKTKRFKRRYRKKKKKPSVYTHFSAVYVLDGDFPEEEKYVILVFQRANEIRVCKTSETKKNHPPPSDLLSLLLYDIITQQLTV